MKKTTLLCVMAILCLYINALAQDNTEDLYGPQQPFYISSWIKNNMPIGKIINYSKNTADFDDFGDKLIILGFWFTSCTPCIRQLPNENRLQKKYAKDVQFILVTYEQENLIKAFVKNWELKNKTRFDIPIVVEDSLLGKAFRAQYNPHYAWILPGGRIVAETNDAMIKEPVINAVLEEAALIKARLQKKGRTVPSNLN